MEPIDKLIEALTIFKKYLKPDAFPTYCSQDELYVMVTSEDDVELKDQQRLAELGFSFDYGIGAWRSGRFGSA